MQIARQRSKVVLPSLDPEPLEQLPEDVKHVFVLLLGDLDKFWVGRVGLDHEVNQLARRRLPALVHPPPGEANTEPDPSQYSPERKK